VGTANGIVFAVRRFLSGGLAQCLIVGTRNGLVQRANDRARVGNHCEMILRAQMWTCKKCLFVAGKGVVVCGLEAQ
jgi:hypothetical protein